MNDAAEIIKTLVAPAVMISACGLLCLAWYNRLAAIVSRARIFNKERFEVAHEIAAIVEDSAAAQQRKASLANRLGVLEEQGRQILRRARMIRNALLCMIVTVMCMIACSLLLGAAMLNKTFTDFALAAFVCGAISMLAGTFPAMFELFNALNPVAVEHATLHDEAFPEL